MAACMLHLTERLQEPLLVGHSYPRNRILEVLEARVVQEHRQRRQEGMVWRQVL